MEPENRNHREIQLIRDIFTQSTHSMLEREIGNYILNIERPSQQILSIRTSILTKSFIKHLSGSSAPVQFLPDMEILVDPVLKLVSFIWGSVSRQIDYAKDLERKVTSLSRTAGELRHRYGNFKAQVRDAESVGKTKLPEVENWLTGVEGILGDVDSIVSDFQRPGGGTCFNGRCPDPRGSFKQGKKVVKKMEVVQQHLEAGAFTKIAGSPPRPLMPEFEVPIQVERQSTSQETLNEIEQALLDEDIGVVCIWGMGGIGKTTLMKKIYNGLARTQDFSIVIWVTVSQVLDLNVIQQKIGKTLGLNFAEKEGTVEKKDKLNVRLKNTKFMLILDDLWEAFSLDQVGIPRPDKKNRCKIAMTTRLMEVSNGMEADKEIRVRTLNTMEAWDLFRSKTGYIVGRPEIQPIAKDVAEECGGLPLAIAVVGAAMRGKDRAELWKNALRALRTGAAHSDVPGMERHLFWPLKLSYDYLDDPKIQLCFLYCCLFPEDCEIDALDLVKYWNCEGLIDNVDTLEEAENKGLAIVEKLKDACLLEMVVRGEGYCVKMHDLLRDLAIWITASPSSSIQASSKFFMNSCSEVPPVEAINWEIFGRISLMSSVVKQLQIFPKCPGVASLLVDEHPNGNSRATHSSFLQLMPQLRILNLTFTDIRSLPSSFSRLVNLRALILTRCKRLVEMPPLGELKELQILDLGWTGIEEFPEGIWKLVKLKQLNLSYTKALNRIPGKSISLLTSLERLELAGDNDRMYAASVSTWRQLAALKRLAYLYIKVVNLDGFTADDFLLLQSFSNCKRIRVYLGRGYKASDQLITFLGDSADENELEICGLENIFDGGAPLPSTRFQRLQRLSIWNCPKLKYILSSAMVSHLCQLEDLEVSDCEGMEEIVQGDILPHEAFQKLSYLDLQRLPKLRSISIQLPVLKSLYRIHVYDCSKLKKLPPLCSDIQTVRGLVYGQGEWWEKILEWEDEHSKSIYSTIYRKLQESKTTEIDGGDEEALEMVQENTEESTKMEEGNEENAELEKMDDQGILEMEQDDEKDALHWDKHRGVLDQERTSQSNFYGLRFFLYSQEEQRMSPSIPYNLPPCLSSLGEERMS